MVKRIQPERQERDREHIFSISFILGVFETGCLIVQDGFELAVWPTVILSACMNLCILQFLFIAKHCDLILCYF